MPSKDQAWIETPAGYRYTAIDLEEALQQLCGEYEGGQGGSNLAQQIASDISNFQMLGLDNLDQAKHKQLIQIYSHFDSPYAREIIDWLNDEYVFDPTEEEITAFESVSNKKVLINNIAFICISFEILISVQYNYQDE